MQIAETVLDVQPRVIAQWGAPCMFVGDSGLGFGSEQGVWHLAPRVELAHTSRDRVVALAEAQIQG